MMNTKSSKIKKLIKFFVFLLLLVIGLPIAFTILAKLFGISDVKAMNQLIERAWLWMSMVKIIIFYLVSFYGLPAFFNSQIRKIDLNSSEESSLDEVIQHNNMRRIFEKAKERKWELFLGLLCFEFVTAQLPFWLKHF